MEIIKYPPPESWEDLCKRPVQDRSKILALVNRVISDVKRNGDAALKKYNKKFSGVSTDELMVSAEEIRLAAREVPFPLRAAIQKAKVNIEKFHDAQRKSVRKVETSPGVVCWRESRPVEKVGLYIPGGSAPLFSTVLMLGVPAKIAGCGEVVLCTPPDPAGRVHPAILFAASVCGIKKIYKTGGAQAIAAMAYGTESIPAVFKIFGPGNQYVTAAKQMVQDKVAIDMPAGPSEVLVIADPSANPSWVAADLLAQAEHGPDSQVILASTGTAMVRKVQAEINRQIRTLPRKELAAHSISNSRFLVFKSLKEAISFSNVYAPEHLILACKVNAGLLKSITSAGSVFLGNYSPESAGDYASGTNHTLPTNGNAAMYSGVSLDSFCKQITFQKLSKKGLGLLAPVITEMAQAEGLHAHGESVRIRMGKNIKLK